LALDAAEYLAGPMTKKSRVSTASPALPPKDDDVRKDPSIAGKKQRDEARARQRARERSGSDD
jgi:hypothetical protein